VDFEEKMTTARGNSKNMLEMNALALLEIFGFAIVACN
jgi:hypothetical protein